MRWVCGCIKDVEHPNVNDRQHHIVQRMLAFASIEKLEMGYLSRREAGPSNRALGHELNVSTAKDTPEAKTAYLVPR